MHLPRTHAYFSFFTCRFLASFILIHATWLNRLAEDSQLIPYVCVNQAMDSPICLTKGRIAPHASTTSAHSSGERHWVTLSLDSTTLGLQTATLTPSMSLSQLGKTLEECAAEGIELIYWTSNVDDEAIFSILPDFPGYVVTRMVEFGQVLDNELATPSCPAGFIFRHGTASSLGSASLAYTGAQGSCT